MCMASWPRIASICCLFSFIVFDSATKEVGIRIVGFVTPATRGVETFADEAIQRGRFRFNSEEICLEISFQGSDVSNIADRLIFRRPSPPTAKYTSHNPLPMAQLANNRPGQDNLFQAKDVEFATTAVESARSASLNPDLTTVCG